MRLGTTPPSLLVWPSITGGKYGYYVATVVVVDQLHLMGELGLQADVRGRDGLVVVVDVLLAYAARRQRVLRPRQGLARVRVTCEMRLVERRVVEGGF